jgi:hypothetical protein
MWRTIIATLLFVVFRIGYAVPPVLIPGASPTDCRSALTIGVVACDQPVLASGSFRPDSEERVDQYLAEYGKPPREAVRALLDPSDANITAWIQKQRQVLSTASYVAARMTEIQSRLETQGSPGLEMLPSQMPMMMQIRATLYINVSEDLSRRAARALEQVVARYPSIDGRLAQVGPPNEGQLRTWLARVDTALPVSILPIEAIQDMPALPSLLIEDLRYGSRRRLSAKDITPQQIRDQIVTLRATGEARDRPLTLPAPQQ